MLTEHVTQRTVNRTIRHSQLWNTQTATLWVDEEAVLIMFVMLSKSNQMIWC